MPYEEGKIGLKNYKIGSSFFLIFCLITSNLYSQFNLNGFYQIHRFETLPGYEKIYQTDFKFNNVTDLVFYSSEINNVILHPSEAQFQFDEPIDKFFFFPMSSIQEINSNSKNNYHVFVSRNERLAGLISFTRFGTLQILNMQKFNTFPSKLIADNFDKDDEMEALVFGSAFEGISILNKVDYTLEEKRFLQGQSFSEVVSIDLDFDGYKDIIAKDLLDNSLVFLYNNHIEGFEVARTWPFSSVVENLSVLDFNKDDFNDLIYNSEEGINVCYGDSVFSFKSKDTWPTNETSDIRIISDFNLDGNYDFLSYNKFSGKLDLNLETESLSNESWFTLLKDTSITDIQILDGYENSILVLTDNGKFYTVSSATQLDSSFTVPSISAMSFAPFISNSDNIGISFLDTLNLELNLTYSENKLFDRKKIIPTVEKFTKISSVNNYENHKYFILSSDSSELFQIIDPSLNDSSYTDFKIYSDFPIVDLIVLQDSLSVEPTVFTLEAKDDTIGLVKFEYKDFHYISSQFNKIAENVLDAKLKYDSSLVIEYCTSTSNSITINKHHIFEDRFDITSEISLPIDSAKSALFTNNFCLITCDTTQYLVDTENYSLLEIPDAISSKLTDVKMFDHKQKKLIARTEDGAILSLKYDRAKKKLSLANYIVSENVAAYFCETLQGKKYIIYKLFDDDFINFLEFK